MKSPVLLIGFNRPDSMQIVFSAVRKARPSKLYYAVDGARKNKDGEEQKVAAVRNIIKQVDWECEVYTLFQQENLGCGYGPVEAINWAFENEDRLIILEDDCVPSFSFFKFCDELLDYYFNDYRVNMISGRSHHPNSIYFKDCDYLFTQYAHSWGWATWKRVWKEYSQSMTDFPEWISGGGSLNVMATTKLGRHSNKFFLKRFKSIEKEISHSWDAQWWYTRQKTGGLGIVPRINLIKNIGSMGTHSYGQTIAHLLECEEMPDNPLRHPSFVIKNLNYERYHYKHHIVKGTNYIVRGYRKVLREINNNLNKLVKMTSRHK